MVSAIEPLGDASQGGRLGCDGVIAVYCQEGCRPERPLSGGSGRSGSPGRRPAATWYSSGPRVKSVLEVVQPTGDRRRRRSPGPRVWYSTLHVAVGQRLHQRARNGGCSDDRVRTPLPTPSTAARGRLLCFDAQRAPPLRTACLSMPAIIRIGCTLMSLSAIDATTLASSASEMSPLRGRKGLQDCGFPRWRDHRDLGTQLVEIS